MTADPPSTSPSPGPETWRQRLDRLYRRARRIARPVHPNRLRANVWEWAVRRGLVASYYRLAAWLTAFTPARLAATGRWLAWLRGQHRRRRNEPRLTIGVDVHAFWEPLTGIGWYLFRLLEHLAQRDDLRLRLYGPDLVWTPDVPRPQVALPAGPAIEHVRYEAPRDLSIPYVSLTGWLQRRQERLIAADRNDILFAPNYQLPPVFSKSQGHLVVTVHDLSFQRVPWTMRESTCQELTRGLVRTLERAAHVLTDSETVRGEIIAAGLAPAAEVEAVHLGPGPVAATSPATPPPPGTPPHYVLFVGSLEPRKDVPTLLAVWRRLRQRGLEPPPLVLCGRLAWKSEALAADIATGQAEGWLLHFGYLPDDQVAALYRGALCVVLPSLYEGFGLPAVEAMVCGAPLLLSDIPVLREIAGEAALYAPPQDVEAWAAALVRLLSDAALRAELRRRGSERRSHFDWQQTASATAAVWFRVAAEAGTAKPAAGRRSVRQRALSIAAVTLAAAGLLAGHIAYWYAPRLRPGTLDPETLVAQLVASPEFEVALWLPYPHQNLGQLEKALGADLELARAAARLGGLPTPVLPTFGALAVPPASEMALASDAEGERIALFARVYPVIAAFARLGGRLAKNPWLAGGEVFIEGRRFEVAWRRNVWTVTSRGLPRLESWRGDLPPPCLAWLETRRPLDPMPAGRYRLIEEDGAFELLSPTPVPPELWLEGRNFTALELFLLLLTGHRTAGDPLQVQAFFAQHHPHDLPRSALVYEPGGERWELPGENLLEMSGRRPQEAVVAGWNVAALDPAGFAGAAQLARELTPLAAPAAGGATLVWGLWLDLEGGLTEVSRIAAVLRGMPLVPRRKVERWNDAERVLAPLVKRFGRVALVVTRDPTALRLRLSPQATGSASEIDSPETIP